MRAVLTAITSTTLIIALSGMTLAQEFEPEGEITMNFDGQELVFHTLSRESDTVRESSASVGSLEFPFPSGAQMLMITGTANSDSTGPSLHLAIGFREHPSKGEKLTLIDQPDLTFYENGQRPPYWSSVSAADIVFSRYDFDGETGHATGTFETRMCLVSDWDTEPDMSTCRDAQGTFDTRLMKAAG